MKFLGLTLDVRVSLHVEYEHVGLGILHPSLGGLGGIERKTRRISLSPNSQLSATSEKSRGKKGHSTTAPEEHRKCLQQDSATAVPKKLNARHSTTAIDRFADGPLP